MCLGLLETELAVDHPWVRVAFDVLDRFIALHYTDWELLNGRYINNVYRD